MLYYLLYPLRDYIGGFNVFRYITFRMAWAALTALAISFILGPWLINHLRSIKAGQFIRAEGPQSHQAKSGTPTMGGILIVLAILVPTILWADIMNPYIWIILFVTISFAGIGFYDDFQKLVKRQNLGPDVEAEVLSADARRSDRGSGDRVSHEIAQSVPVDDSYLSVRRRPGGRPGSPLHSVCHFDLVGASNAVNLTDGLDGLAIGCTLVAAATYTCSPMQRDTRRSRTIC